MPCTMTKIFIQADFDKVAQTCEPWQPSICRIFRCPSKGQPHYGEISIPTVFFTHPVFEPIY